MGVIPASLNLSIYTLFLTTSHALGLGVGHKDGRGARKDTQLGNFSSTIVYSGAQAHPKEYSIE